MPGKRHSIAKDLIAQLSQNLQVAELETTVPIAETAAPVEKATDAPELQPEKISESSQESLAVTENSSVQGIPYAFQMNEEDERILQEVSMQLYSQGIKPTNNLIFRAALRLLQDDEAFLTKAREIKGADGRIKRGEQMKKVNGPTE